MRLVSRRAIRLPNVIATEMDPGPTVSGSVNGVEGAPGKIRRIRGVFRLMPAVVIFAVQQGPGGGNRPRSPLRRLERRAGEMPKTQDVGPIRIEIISNTNPFRAILRARTVRISLVNPLVMLRKMGTFPSGLTIGKSARHNQKGVLDELG